MNDTLSVKELSSSTLDAANFPGTARSFARIQGSNQSEYQRQSLHVSSLSPALLRMSHQYPKSGTVAVRSLAALEQTLARLDAQSNPISFDKVTVKLQSERTSGITLAEFRTAGLLLAGLILESNGAFLDQFYNGEV